MNITLKAIIRRQRTKSDGTCPVLLRVTIDRKQKYYPLSVYLNPNDWDDDHGQVLKRNNDAFKINSFITSCKKKANDAILNMQMYEKPINFNSFEELFLKKRIMTIEDLIDDFLENNSGRLCAGSIAIYQQEKRKLRGFKQNVSLLEIDNKFLIKYENYLRNELKNVTNTVNKSFRKLRALLNYAHKINVLDRNHYPFNNYRIKDSTVDKEFLTIEEIKRLIQLYENDLSDKFLNTLNYFLFALYTGLRYSDVLALNKSNVFETENIKYIKVHTQKTKETTIIPLTNEALNCIAFAELHKSRYQGEKLFNVYTNQKTNEYLKLIAMYAKIEKKLSFHTARYTFANVLSNSGMDIKTIQHLMAHSDQKMTEKYTKFKVKNMLGMLDAFKF